MDDRSHITSDHAAEPQGKSLEELYRVVLQRKREQQPPDSSTVKELKAGPRFIGKKIVEEAAEVWMASEHESDTPGRIALEISQVLYHLVVMMVAHDLTLEDVYRCL